MVCTSCKTSYNVLSHSPVTKLGPGSPYSYQRGGGGGGGGWLVIWSLIFRGVLPKRESPDFRFPEVGISVIVLTI